MNILKTITPLIIGAFFLTANANLPDRVTVINKTSQDLFIAVSNSNQEQTYKGLTIKIGKQYSFESSIPCYPEYNDYHPNFLYIYNKYFELEYNYLEHRFFDFIEKIDLQEVTNKLINNLLQNIPANENIILEYFKVQSFYSTAKQLTLILKDR